MDINNNIRKTTTVQETAFFKRRNRPGARQRRSQAWKARQNKHSQHAEETNVLLTNSPIPSPLLTANPTVRGATIRENTAEHRYTSRIRQTAKPPPAPTAPFPPHRPTMTRRHKIYSSEGYVKCFTQYDAHQPRTNADQPRQSIS